MIESGTVPMFFTTAMLPGFSHGLENHIAIAQATRQGP